MSELWYGIRTCFLIDNPIILFGGDFDAFNSLDFWSEFLIAALWFAQPPRFVLRMIGEVLLKFLGKIIDYKYIIGYNSLGQKWPMLVNIQREKV